ncbi:uncharacterized protein LOC141642554 [Silene latifolia]|uniref:uncharacterized protein LOC141642554 n=1 Tax=Silene latifolia TaxID=37657 RepID=UPI003D78A42B
MSGEPFTVDVSYYHGGKFETTTTGKIDYVGGKVSLKYGFWSDKFCYSDVFETGMSLMKGKYFITYFKLKGKTIENGLQRLQHQREMDDLLNSRDRDTKLDLYFVEAVRRVEKLPTRRKLSAVLEREFEINIVETSNIHNNKGNRQKRKEPVDVRDEEYDEESNRDDGYCTEDSEFSDIDIGNNEVDGDLVEEEELFTDINNF